MNWETKIKILEAKDNDLQIIIPFEIEQVIEGISKKITDTEFSILGNIIEETDESIILSPEYYIPEQEVTAASVDIIEDVSGYDVVFHTHPAGVKNFSRTDVESINNNFRLSILIESDSFIKASRRLKISDGRFLHIITDNIIIARPVLEVNTEKIKKKVPKYIHQYEYDIYNYLNEKNGGIYGY